MAHLSSKFIELIKRLGYERVESSIPELAELLEINAETPLLNRVALVNTVLSECGIRISPNLDQGEYSERRVLYLETKPKVNSGEVLSEIKQGESFSLEFKSTYQFDLDRFKHQFNASSAALKSKDVRFSSLKTIAAFLNSGGGILYIGVADDTSIVGLEYDYYLLNGNADQLENSIRTDVAAQFSDKGILNDYLVFDPVEVNGLEVMRVVVSKRGARSFLRPLEPRHAEEYCLYRRQGNRTAEVYIHQMEEFQRWCSEQGI